MLELLAIVEVDRNSRVRCKADGCNRPVFKAVHIVRDDGNLSVLGCSCFTRLYGAGRKKKWNAYYTRSGSRRLSPEESEALEQNTQILIARFEAEHWETMKVNKVPEVVVAVNTYQPAPQTRRVSCLYCGEAMETRARNTPVSGHKCDLCIQYNRAAPNAQNARFGITMAANARANRLGHKYIQPF